MRPCPAYWRRSGQRHFRLTVAFVCLALPLCLSARADSGRKWAILIGVNKYWYVNELQYCVADVQMLKETLLRTAGYRPENVVVLSDAATEQRLRPFKANIIHNVGLWSRAVGRDDSLLFYFSGHGFRSQEDNVDYLLPVDATIEDLKGTAIPLGWIIGKLESSKASRTVLITDACREVVAKGVGVQSRFGSSETDRLARSKGMVLLRSCLPEEESQEAPALGHGAYTYFLAKALEGEADSYGPSGKRDGEVTAAEVESYVRDKVSAYVRENLYKEQHPTGVGPMDSPIVLSTLPDAAAIKAANPPEVQAVVTTASIFVNSSPPGAKVLMDNEAKGKTPLLVTVDLGGEKQKAVEVIAELPGYRSKGERIPLRRGQKVERTYTMVKLPASTLTNPAGYEFLRVPAGEGVAEFEIGKNDVTVAQFRKFIDATGYKTTAEKQGWSLGYDGKEWSKMNALNWRFGINLNDQGWRDNHPAVHVTKQDARAFCDWIGGRLPTNAEWEHAARGGLPGKKYVWGDEWPPPPGSGNFADVTAKRKYPGWTVIEGYDDGFTDSSPVGSFKPNGYGLYDMAGNVWQWAEEENWCRGGSFYYYSFGALPVAFRYNYDSPYFHVGFRAARTLR